MKGFYLVILVTLINLSCFGQKSSYKLKLTDLSFETIFGYNKNDSSITYCLLGQDFFRTPRSENVDSVINDWIIKHVNAEVIPVSSFGPVMTDDPKSRMIYCWLVDKVDTLNIQLIRQGCFPGATMQRQPTRKEMNRYEKKMYKGVDIEVFVSKDEYKSFIERIIEVENYAKEEKLGVWKEID